MFFMSVFFVRGNQKFLELAEFQSLKWRKRVFHLALTCIHLDLINDVQRWYHIFREGVGLRSVGAQIELTFDLSFKSAIVSLISDN